MIRKTLALAAASAVVMGSAAFAQAPGGDSAPSASPPSAAPPAQSPAPETPSSSAITEEKLRAFAKATATLQQQPNLSPQEQVQKVEQSGLSAQEYNTIAETARNDPNILQQLQQFMQQQQPAAPAAPAGQP